MGFSGVGLRCTAVTATPRRKSFASNQKKRIARSAPLTPEDNAIWAKHNTTLTDVSFLADELASRRMLTNMRTRYCLGVSVMSSDFILRRRKWMMAFSGNPFPRERYE